MTITNEKSRLMFKLDLYQVIKKLTKWWRHNHKKGCLKLIRSFFSYHTKGFANIFIKIERLNQELFMSKFKYQNSTKWWRHQKLGLNLLKRRSFLFLSIIQKASQTKFYKIWISKSKVTHVQIPVPISEKTKIREKNFWVTKRESKGIISRDRF